jgi:hypothetical protein
MDLEDQEGVLKHNGRSLIAWQFPKSEKMMWIMDKGYGQRSVFGNKET